MTVLLLCLFLAAQEPDPAADLYFSANALYNRGLYDLAADEYASFLKKHPRHEKAGPARLGLALSFHALGRSQDAEPLLAGLAADPKAEDPARLHLLWGHALLALDRNADAEKAFDVSNERAAEAGSKRDAEIGLLEARYRQGKWKDVLRSAERLSAAGLDPAASGRVAFQTAAAHHEMGKFDEAIRLLAPLVDSPLAPQVFLLLGESRRGAGDLEGAARAFESAASKTDGTARADAQWRAAQVRVQQGKDDEAIRLFAEVARNPKDAALAARAVLGLARAHVRRGRAAEAEKALDAILEKAGPLRAEILYESGRLRLDRSAFKEAAERFLGAAEAGADKPLAATSRWLAAAAFHKVPQLDRSLKLCEEFLERHRAQENAPDAAFLRAENLYLLDRPADARKAYEEFLRDHSRRPEVPLARLRAGQTLHQQKQWSEALNRLDPLLAESPQGAAFEPLPFLIGECAFRLERWDRAIEALGRFVDSPAQRIHGDAAFFMLAQALERKGELRPARDALARLVRHHPKSPHRAAAGSELGRLHHEAGDLPAARKALEQTLEIGPDPRARYYLGWVCLGEKNEAEAERQFRAALEKGPPPELAADAALQAGILALRRGAFGEAQELLERALRIPAASAKADQVLFYLAQARARQKQWDAALQAFQQILDGHPKSPLRERTLFEAAGIEKERGRRGEASRRFGELIAAFPNGALAQDAALEQAELEFEDKNYDAALRRLATVQRADLRPRARYRMGCSHARKGDLTEAARAFERLLEEDGASELAPLAAHQAGEARLALRDYGSARRHFARAAESGARNPALEQSLVRQGECDALSERWADAEQSYLAFLKAYPKSAHAPQAKFGVGWTLENRGKPEEALRWYREAVEGAERSETGARSQFQIGECLFALRRGDEAIKELIKVEANYAHAEWSSRAILEIGRVLQSQGKSGPASERYQEVVRRFGGTEAAAAARQLLERLAD